MRERQIFSSKKKKRNYDTLSVEKYINFSSNKFSCFPFPELFDCGELPIHVSRREEEEEVWSNVTIYIFQSEEGDKNRE